MSFYKWKAIKYDLKAIASKSRSKNLRMIVNRNNIYMLANSKFLTISEIRPNITNFFSWNNRIFAKKKNACHCHRLKNAMLKKTEWNYAFTKIIQTHLFFWTNFHQKGYQICYFCSVFLIRLKTPFSFLINCVQSYRNIPKFWGFLKTKKPHTIYWDNYKKM